MRRDVGLARSRARPWPGAPSTRARPSRCEVGRLVVDVENPVADPVVVVVAAGRGPRLDPELVVLAVAVDGQPAGEAAAGMRAELGLADREHAVGGDAHEVRPGSQVVDDTLDGDDGAPARGQGSPHPFEERRVHRDVAVAVGDRGVQQRDVGHAAARGARPDRRASRRAAYASLSSIDDPAMERVVTAGQAAGGGFEPLREGEERPVLDLDVAPLVGAGEDRVRREVREGVTRVAGDDAPRRARRGRTARRGSRG